MLPLVLIVFLQDVAFVNLVVMKPVLVVNMQHQNVLVLCIIWLTIAISDVNLNGMDILGGVISVHTDNVQYSVNTSNFYLDSANTIDCVFTYRGLQYNTTASLMNNTINCDAPKVTEIGTYFVFLVSQQLIVAFHI